ncbi:MAG: hypothetical protein H0V44_11245 [Planctomycetes bacterium]|nr:hypothetical protein [Planctomycetota bacterium]
MRTFTDATGRAWSIAITVDTLKRVRALVQIDLLDVLGGHLLETLSSDPVVLCDVLFAAVKPEADARQVSDVDFGRAMAGDAIEQATRALLDDLVDFFPQPKRRLLAKALGKLTTWQAKALDAAEQRLDGPKLQAALTAALMADPEPTDLRPGDSSGSALESSAVTPDR